MIKWVEVLRRILRLYGVATQQEMGMALGVPVSIHAEGGAHDMVIPWEILAMVVGDKRVSWDWLLTGAEFRGERRDDDEPGHPIKPVPPSGAKQAINNTESRNGQPPRLETRELARTLLPQTDAPDRPEAPPEEEPDPAREAPRESHAEMVRRLEELKASVQKEIENVERLLKEGD